MSVSEDELVNKINELKSLASNRIDEILSLRNNKQQEVKSLFNIKAVFKWLNRQI